MLKFKGIKIVSFVLAVLMIISVVAPSTALAELKSTSRKTNFNWISINDLSHIEYTYNENGESYKVIESANLELTEAHTKIYKKVAGEYVLISDYTTRIKINDSTIELTTIKGGNLDVVKIKKDDVIAPAPIEEFNKDTSISSIDTVEVGLTDWIYCGTTQSSSTISEWTFIIVVAILNDVAHNKFTKGQSYLVTGVTTVATLVISEYWPKVYDRQYWYNIYETFDGVPAYVPAVGEKVYTYFYSDSSRTQRIGDVLIDEFIVDGAGQ